jgi:hypothetical protein
VRGPYGAMATQAAKDALKGTTGYDYDTVRGAGWVAERFEFVRRLTNLRWHHHQAVATLPPAEADAGRGRLKILDV